MKKQNVRVIIASEYPEVQYFLRGVVEKGGDVITVGQAKDASEVLTLVRNLRPDVAIIDCYLPYVCGLDTILLSRIGGLDIAQTISEEIPKIRVILLNNLDTLILPERGLGSDVDGIYSIVSKGANVPFAPQDPGDKLVQPGALVFASVEAKSGASISRRDASLSDKAIFFGALGILGGWLLTITMIFAPAGVSLALAGAATMLLGLAGKLNASWWRKLLRKRARLQETKRRAI